jgi:gamma-glutamylcyclotransferase (GGCT)/AIG2-like uncharacterized protein YtfP
MAEREFIVFVCGATMAGEAHHELLAGATALGPGKTQPAFDLIDLGATGSLAAGGRMAVTGEVYSVSAPILAALDVHEGHPILHKRTTITLEDGRAVEAWLLDFEQVRGKRRVRSGDWRQRRQVTRASDGGPVVQWARRRFRSS